MVCWRMLMSLKGQPKLSVKTYGHQNLRSSERTGASALSLLLGVLLLLCLAPAAFAQVVSSSTLRGVVKDPSGGLVPNATVKLTSTQRGGERVVKTNDEGSFVFTSVDPGQYKLRVEVSGFKAFEQNGITLSPSDSRSVEVGLEVGLASETVTITGEAAPIKTDTGERSDTISAKQLDNLSIIGRS